MIRKYYMWRAVVVGLVLMLALVSGCQQQENLRETQVGPLSAADAGQRKELAGYEAEIAALQRQYNEILRQREAELATCQARNADLETELKEIMGENAELRDKMRTVKTELARLQDVLGPQTGPPEDR